MALALDANGASKVFVVGRRESKLQETADLAVNGSVIPVTGDVSSKASIKTAYDRIAQQTDFINLLVVSSGVAGSPPSPQPRLDGGEHSLIELQKYLWEDSTDGFSNVLHVNVTGSYFAAVAFLPLLDVANQRHPAPVSGVLSPPRPQIIIMSSIAAYLRVGVGGYAYHASKAATNALIKMLSTSLANYKIRVNGIAAGPYYSEMTANFFDRRDITGQGISEGSVPKEFIPLTRAGAPEDMAGIILWMAGSAGGFLNGSIVITDGGRLGVHPSSA